MGQHLEVDPSSNFSMGHQTNPYDDVDIVLVKQRHKPSIWNDGFFPLPPQEIVNLGMMDPIALLT